MCSRSDFMEEREIRVLRWCDGCDASEDVLDELAEGCVTVE